MRSRSVTVKCKPYNDTNKVVDELFDTLRSRYQVNLEKSMIESDFIFD